MKTTIRAKIIIFTLLIVLLALFSSGFLFIFTYYKTLKEDVKGSLEFEMSSVTAYMTDKLTSINNIIYTFFATEEIRNWKSGKVDFSNTTENYEVISRLTTDVQFSTMFNDAWQQKLIESSYMFADGECIHLLSRIFQPINQSITEMEKIYEESLSMPSDSFYISPSDDDKKVYYIKRMWNNQGTKGLTILCRINNETFSHRLTTLSDKTSAFVLDEKGDIFFSNWPEYRNTNLSLFSSSSEKSIYFQNQIGESPYYIYLQYPMAIYYDLIIPPIRHYFLLMLLLTFVFLFIAGYFSNVYTRFFKDIKIQLKELQNKNYTAKLPSYRDYDLDNISNAFNSMTAEIETLIHTIYEGNLLLKDSEIKLLQSQMNPHFLINTLTTISTNCLLKGDSQTYQMVAALNTLLSATLYQSSSESLIPLKKEMEYINLYLYLQKIRFQDKLEYEINIEDDALYSLHIPRLSIEPIIENAIIHGIENTLGKGIVTISIFREENRLVATILDNGNGFDVQKVFEEQKPEKSDQRRPHLGILNTHKRIQLMFGDSYGIQFTSEINKGTLATIVLPIYE